MPDDIRLGVRLDADGKGFVGEVRISGRELDRFGAGAKRADAATWRLARTTGRTAASVRRTGQAFAEAHGHMARYLSGAGAFYALSPAAGRQQDRHRAVDVEVAGRRAKVAEAD